MELRWRGCGEETVLQARYSDGWRDVELVEDLMDKEFEVAQARLDAARRVDWEMTPPEWSEPVQPSRWGGFLWSAANAFIAIFLYEIFKAILVPVIQ